MAKTAPETAHTDKAQTGLRPSTLEQLNNSPTDTMGFTMTPENQQLWDASLPEYLNGTKMQKLVIVLTRFPKHWLIINQYALPLTFLAITPLLIVGGLARMIKDKVPNYTGLFEDHSQQPPDVPCLIVRSIQSILSYTSNYAVVVAFGVTWWSRSIVLPVVRKWVLPFYLFHVVFGIASLVIAYASGEPIPLDWLLMMLMIIVSVYLFTREVGQQLEGRSFGNLLAGKIFGCLLPFFVILMLYQSVVFPNLGTWGNMTKILFACIVNPIVWEVPFALSRAVARTFAHNHPATNYALTSINIAGKKALGRFVLSSIDDSALILVASLLLSAFEIISMITVGARDRWTYRLFIGEKGGDPLAVPRHERNRKLRCQLANIETTFELVFIVYATFAIGFFDVATLGAPDYGKKTEFGSLFVSAAIQYGCELLVDLIVTIYLTVVANQPTPEYAHLRHRHFFFTVGAVTFFAATYLTSNLQYILFRVAPIGPHMDCLSAQCGHQSAWVWISDCVEKSNVTFNACL